MIYNQAFLTSGQGQLSLDQMSQLRAQCGLPDYALIDDAADDLKLREDDAKNLGLGPIDARAGVIENREDVRFEHRPDDNLESARRPSLRTRPPQPRTHHPLLPIRLPQQ